MDEVDAFVARQRKGRRIRIAIGLGVLSAGAATAAVLVLRIKGPPSEAEAHQVIAESCGLVARCGATAEQVDRCTAQMELAIRDDASRERVASTASFILAKCSSASCDALQACVMDALGALDATEAPPAGLVEQVAAIVCTGGDPRDNERRMAALGRDVAPATMAAAVKAALASCAK